MLPSILDGIFSGLSVGSILLLAALGLAIVFGLMGVINMAHGELMMLGAYTTFVVQNIFKPLGAFSQTYIFFALIAAFVVAALAGLILERGVIRFLYGRPLETSAGNLGREFDASAVCPQRELGVSGWPGAVLPAVFWRHVDCQQAG